MIIDYVLQTGIQLAFIIGILGSLMIKLTNYKINKNLKLGLNILGSLGIYHYFILPIIFVHEFGAYEGLDYRNLLKDDNGEPIHQNIIFRKDKNTTLEADLGLVGYIKRKTEKTKKEKI